MRIFVTEKNLKDKINNELRFAKIEGETSAHLGDCAQWRKETKTELLEIKNTIRENRDNLDAKLDKMEESVIKRHEDNSSKLNKVLIMIILGILGFVGTKIWDQIVQFQIDKSINVTRSIPLR